MSVTAKRARELALALENATSYPHFDRLAFRTPRRTFATLARSGKDLNFMFDLAQQAHFCALAPHALAPVPGGWGRMGATSCELGRIDLRTFKLALEAAHARANAPRPKPTRSAKEPRATKEPRAAKNAPATARRAAGPSKPLAPKKPQRSTKAPREG
jgi:hypothetical protein